MIDPVTLAQLHADLGIASDYERIRRLPLQPEIAEENLVAAEPEIDSALILLAAPAASAWREMKAVAADEGVPLQLISGFRSVRRQAEIVRSKLARGMPIEEILCAVAAPGHSEHHTGRAVDIGTPGCPPLEEGFGETPAFRWLAAHGARFGFTLSYPRNNPQRIAFEPWHWLWRPVAEGKSRPAR